MNPLNELLVYVVGLFVVVILLGAKELIFPTPPKPVPKRPGIIFCYDLGFGTKEVRFWMRKGGE